MTMINNTIEDLVYSALYCDEIEHKQWYLEQIAECIGIDVKGNSEILDFDESWPGWKPGVQPN